MDTQVAEVQGRLDKLQANMAQLAQQQQERKEGLEECRAALASSREVALQSCSEEEGLEALALLRVRHTWLVWCHACVVDSHRCCTMSVLPRQ